MKEIVLRVPEWVSEEEIKKLVEDYLRKKKLVEKFYKLLEGVDFDELAKECENFRKSFKFRISH